MLRWPAGDNFIDHPVKNLRFGAGGPKAELWTLSGGCVDLPHGGPEKNCQISGDTPYWVVPKASTL